MNEFGDRLDALAERATMGATLEDPSLGVRPRPRAASRRRLLVPLVALIAIVAGLLLWQGRDDSTVSVAAGQRGDSETGLAPGIGDEPCDVDELVAVLQGGMATFDYEPAGSYAALHDASPALTGTIESIERVVVNGTSFTEITVSDTYELTTGVARPDIDTIAYEAAWVDRSSPDPLADLVRPTNGRFVGFLTAWSGVRGGWHPGPEGLYVSCGSGQPLAPVIGDAQGPGDPPSPTVGVLRQVLIEAEEPLDVEAARLALREAWDAERAARTDPATQAELQRITRAAGQALWRASAIGNYEMRYTEFTDAPSAVWMTVRVENNQVVDVEYIDEDTSSDRTWTVDQMYAAAAEADTVRSIMYDFTTGALLELSLEPDRTVTGDEYAFYSIEFVRSEDLDAVDELLADWLPEPIDVPDGLQAMFATSARYQLANVEEMYVLHQLPELHIFLYTTNGQVCVLAAQIIGDTDGEFEYNGITSTCPWKTDFLFSPIRLGHVGGDGVEYLLVVPQLSVADEAWTADGEGGDVDVTERSILLVAEGKAVPGAQKIFFNCECGDRVFTLSG